MQLSLRIAAMLRKSRCRLFITNTNRPCTSRVINPKRYQGLVWQHKGADIGSSWRHKHVPQLMQAPPSWQPQLCGLLQQSSEQACMHSTPADSQVGTCEVAMGDAVKGQLVFLSCTS